jgi:hypothetical protein
MIHYLVISILGLTSLCSLHGHLECPLHFLSDILDRLVIFLLEDACEYEVPQFFQNILERGRKGTGTLSDARVDI